MMPASDGDTQKQLRPDGFIMAKVKNQFGEDQGAGRNVEQRGIAGGRCALDFQCQQLALPLYRRGHDRLGGKSDPFRKSHGSEIGNVRKRLPSFPGKGVMP